MAQAAGSSRFWADRASRSSLVHQAEVFFLCGEVSFCEVWSFCRTMVHKAGKQTKGVVESSEHRVYLGEIHSRIRSDVTDINDWTNYRHTHTDLNTANYLTQL